jgi:hypothetical protein
MVSLISSPCGASWLKELLMFLGRNAGLGLSSAKELSSLSNKQLGLTDRAVSSQARLAETKVNKSAVLKDRVSKGA